MEPRLEVLDAWLWDGFPTIQGFSFPKLSWWFQDIIPEWPTMPCPFWVCLDLPDTNHSSAKSHLVPRNRCTMGGLAPLAPWGCPLITWRWNNTVYTSSNCLTQSTYHWFVILPWNSYISFLRWLGGRRKLLLSNKEPTWLLNIIFLMTLRIP